MISPVSLLRPMNTRPNAPMPMSSPRVQLNGGRVRATASPPPPAAAAAAAAAATAASKASSPPPPSPAAAAAAACALTAKASACCCCCGGGATAPATPAAAVAAADGGRPAARRSGEPDDCDERLRASLVCCSCCRRSAAVNAPGPRPSPAPKGRCVGGGCGVCSGTRAGAGSLIRLRQAPMVADQIKPQRSASLFKRSWLSAGEGQMPVQARGGSLCCCLTTQVSKGELLLLCCLLCALSSGSKRLPYALRCEDAHTAHHGARRSAPDEEGKLPAGSKCPQAVDLKQFRCDDERARVSALYVFVSQEQGVVESRPNLSSRLTTSSAPRSGL